MATFSGNKHVFKVTAFLSFLLVIGDRNAASLNCVAPKDYIYFNQLADTDAEMAGSVFEQLCAVHPEISSFYDCFKHCNLEESCVALAHVQRECWICDTGATGEHPVDERLWSRFLLWNPHLMLSADVCATTPRFCSFIIQYANVFNDSLRIPNTI